jgi:hypothetical protein
MSEELKPCRQCGGGAKSNTYDVSIECSACGYEEETDETWNADRKIDTCAIEAAVLRKWAVRFGREAYPKYEDKFGEGHYLALTNASRMMHEEANRIEQEQAK